MNLVDYLASKKILVCGGSGGVGKTTIAAAIGVHLAQAGRSVVVITIDPARRLADALGIDLAEGKLREIPLGTHGAMYAAMLDPTRATDRFMARLVPDAAARARLAQSRFYQEGMAFLANSPEYLAMEEMHDLAQDPDLDHVVLDTPPTRQSLDFLTAPGRLVRLIEERATVKRIVAPYLAASRVGAGILRVGARSVFKFLDKFFGAGTLREFFDFFELAVRMLDINLLQARARKVEAVLRDPRTGFLLVAAPHAASLEEARFFHSKIQTFQIPFGGFIVNRVHPPLPGADDAWERLLGDREHVVARVVHASGPDAGGAMASMLDAAATYRVRAQVEQRHLADLAATAGDSFVAVVPRLDRDVADLDGVKAIAAAFADA